MRRQKLLHVLFLGFGLVIVLLAAVAYIGARKSRTIQDNATALVRDHMITARLVDELEVQQHRMNNLLLRLSRLERAGDASKLIQDAAESNQVVQRLADSSTRDRETWVRLAQSSSDFGRSVREALGDPAVEDQEMRALLDHHDRFVSLAGNIIRADSSRAAGMESEIQRQSQDLVDQTTLLLAACFLLACACAGLSIKVTADSLRQIEWQSQELNRVSWHMLQGQEAAARRFSHEMHDELGQSLTGLKTTLSFLTGKDFDSRKQDCLHILDESIGNVRELSQLLRPVILDDFGLDAALRWLCERFQERTRIEAKYSSTFSDRLADGTETQLFRITQESLTNVARHSGARKVVIHLQRRGEHVLLTIEDDGRGLGNTSVVSKPSLGMTGMRARAAQAGGEVTFSQSGLGGVKIEVEVPARTPVHEPDTEDAYPAGR